MSRSNTSRSRLYTVNVQKSFLAPSPEPKISHSSPTAIIETNQEVSEYESIVEVMVLVEEMTWMILRGMSLMFGQGS